MKSEPAHTESTSMNLRPYDSSPVIISRSKDKNKIPSVKETPVKTTVKPNSGQVSFRVQIGVSTTDIGTHAKKFSVFRDIKMYKHNGMYKYTVGDETNLEGAVRLLYQVKNKGVKDAFIVVFRNDERIPQEEANRLLGK